MDPYSHTPAHAGARQPGLTGQVKEDFLCRMGELGLLVKNGELHFRPSLLRREEFLTAPAEFVYYDVAGLKQRLRLPPGTLAFTCCQVPVLYRLARENSLLLISAHGETQSYKELLLDADTSRLIFDRTGKISRLEVSLAYPTASRKGRADFASARLVPQR